MAIYDGYKELLVKVEQMRKANNDQEDTPEIATLLEQLDVLWDCMGDMERKVTNAFVEGFNRACMLYVLSE